MQEERPARHNLRLQVLLSSALLVPAVIQARYGSPELFGDDISYLDISNALRAGDWHNALSPYWSIGYPLLLTPLSYLFPASVHGQMQAAALLHVLIFLAGWLTFLFFIRTARSFLANVPPEPLSPSLLCAAAIIFLTVETCFGRVSTFGPDELVACIFFLASGLLLRFAERPTVRNGVLLGLALGVGYVAKVIFLPLSVIFVAAALLPLRRRLPMKIAFSIPAAMLALMLPYAASLSAVAGRPTLGDSGPLNYAWSVNHLPHWMGWQGRPPNLGYPLHPVHLLRDNPAVFAFGEPFHTTYPPQFNLEYWYDGYHRFFSLPNAVHASLLAGRSLIAVLHENMFFTLMVFAVAVLLLYANPDSKRLFRRWQIWLPAALGVVLYLQVTLEARYILGFTAILAVTPFLCATSSSRRRLAAVALLAMGSSINLFLHLREPIGLALRFAPVETATQWRVGKGLAATGLKPGDRVATVTTLNQIRCTWAYAAGLHIVASIGNDGYSPQNQQQDFNLFWTDPTIQQQVLQLFRQQGAVAVVVPAASTPALSAEWQKIPDTDAWVHRL